MHRGRELGLRHYLGGSTDEVTAVLEAFAPADELKPSNDFYRKVASLSHFISVEVSS